MYIQLIVVLKIIVDFLYPIIYRIKKERTIKMFNDTITTDLFKGQKEERFLIKDIATHGCSGGVSGLTYYTETIAFYDKHKKEIWDMLYDLSEDSGFSIPFLMSDFDGARNVSDHDTFKNFLVWWAVTQKAREIEQRSKF